MTAVDLRTQAGDRVGSTQLDPGVFGIEPNQPVMHQVVTAQLAAARAGGHNTLTRAEVSGGGAKPWRQKGSGRARQGSSRAPHWRGGGVAGGPKPRSYRQRTPKKMVQLALRSALSDRAAEGRVAVVEGWDFDAPRTRDAKAALAALGLDGKVLVVLSRDDENAFKSFRNLPQVHLLVASELNAYDVLCADWVVFTAATLPGGLRPDAQGGSADPSVEDPVEAATGPAPADESPSDESSSDESPGTGQAGVVPPGAASPDVGPDWDLPLRSDS